MKVIFLQDVPRVGKRHDIKELPDGYVQNFLIPRKLAERATPSAINELEKRRKNLELEKGIQEDLLMRHLAEIKDKVVHLKGKANDKGSLFSAIHKKEIIEAMHKEHNAKIDEDFIVLDKPIKETGEFEIPVIIKGKNSSFKLKVEKI